MVFLRKVRIFILLGGTMLIAISGPSLAATKKSVAPQLDPRIGVLEQQLRGIQQQLAEIKRSHGQNDSRAAVVDLKRYWS